MFSSKILRAVQAKPFDFARNPYKAKRVWPPDFEKLSDRHQFRLERRYKRRSKLKWARPKLMIATKLTQWIGGITVLIYGVIFMDWGDNGKAFKGIRETFHRNTGHLFGGSKAPQPQSPSRPERTK